MPTWSWYFLGKAEDPRIIFGGWRPWVWFTWFSSWWLQPDWKIHPGRLTWNLRIQPWKRKNIFQTIIFRFQLWIFECVILVELDHETPQISQKYLRCLHHLVFIFGDCFLGITSLFLGPVDWLICWKQVPNIFHFPMVFCVIYCGRIRKKKASPRNKFRQGEYFNLRFTSLHQSVPSEKLWGISIPPGFFPTKSKLHNPFLQEKNCEHSIEDQWKG